MTWWTRLPSTHKVVTAIVMTACALILAGAMMADFLTLPDRVVTLEESVDKIERRQRDLLDTAERTNCYLDNLIQGENKRCP